MIMRSSRTGPIERKQRGSGRGLLRKAVRFMLIILAAAWMLFEEWVWDNILAVMAYASRLKAVRTVEAFLRRQHPYTLLVLFVIPFLVMVPAKLFGLYLIANGRVLRGISVFIIAKVTITALVTRLFVVSKDKLLLIPSFAAFYSWFDDKRKWLYSEVRKLQAWQMAQALVRKFRNALADARRKARRR
jgi:hypothetical protein